MDGHVRLVESPNDLTLGQANERVSVSLLDPAGTDRLVPRQRFPIKMTAQLSSQMAKWFHGQQRSRDGHSFAPQQTAGFHPSGRMRGKAICGICSGVARTSILV